MKYYLLLCLLALPLLWSLIKPGFYSSHDGEWMVIRLTAFHQTLREGQFPVRWTRRLNHEYGYPVMNFLYPLPFYAAEPFYLLSGNPATAVKIVMGISILSMVIGMFAFLKKWGAWPALVGTLALAYAPYIAFDLYERGSLGEIFALGIVPWIFWAISTKRYPIAALLQAALIFSHNVIALLFVPIIIIYSLISNRRNWSNVKCQMLMVALALGLSASFWLPALFELKYVRASQITVSDFANEFLTIKESFLRSGLITTIFTAGLPLLLLTRLSTWLWESVKVLQIIQFPWRLLSLFSFLAALVVVKLMEWLKSRTNLSLVIGLLIISPAVVSSAKFLTPESFINRPPEYYRTNDDTTTVRAEFTPIWVDQLPTTRPELPAQHYYPGWKVFINGKEVEIQDPRTTNGVITPLENRHQATVRLAWSETPLRFGANLISVVSSLVLLVWLKEKLRPIAVQ